MAKQIIVTQNDYGIELETQFVDDKKKPLDITDYDVRVKVIYDDKTIDTILAGHKDSVNGIAYIVLEKEHLINAGLHTSVWSVVDEDEHVTAQENVYYFVKDVEGSEDDTPTTDLPIDANSILNKFKDVDDRLFEQNKQLDTIKNGTVCATDFGVKGDGVTDDTLALQKAIDSLKPKDLSDLWSIQNCGGTIILPSGKINFSKLRLYSNVTIQGTGMSIFGRENTHTVLNYIGDNKTPAISFVGIDMSSKSHSDLLIVDGYDMDNCIISQTWNTKIKDVTVSCNNGQGELGINLSGCPNCSLENVSINYFDCGLLISGAWNVSLNNCYTFTNHCGAILANGNSVNFTNVYMNPSNNKKESLNSNNILSQLVNDENLLVKNKSCGIYNIGVEGLVTNKLIAEKFNIGVNVGLGLIDGQKAFYQNSFNNSHFEKNDIQFVFNNANATINGLYCYTEGTSDFLIKATNSNLTGINVQSVTYRKIIENEETNTLNFFNCQNEWNNYNKQSISEIGKTIFQHYNDEAIIKTWQSKRKIIIGDTTVEISDVNKKINNIACVNASFKGVNTAISDVDVSNVNNIVLNSNSTFTLYNFTNGVNFQEITVLALNSNININGVEGNIRVKDNYIIPVPTYGIIKFICYENNWYEISRSF